MGLSILLAQSSFKLHQFTCPKGYVICLGRLTQRSLRFPVVVHKTIRVRLLGHASPGGRLDSCVPLTRRKESMCQRK